MILLLDNFDSFTYNLVDYFAQLGIQCEVIRNDVSIEDLKTLPIEAIILSPGTGTPNTAGVLMDVVREYHDKVPMLGICLGHQAIGEFFGMKLIKAEHPRHGKITSINILKNPIFNKIPDQIKVVQYNSLILEDNENKSIEVISKSEYGHVMAIAHKTLPLWGLQFHPEAALTEYGLLMLKNWVDCAQLKI